jgi:hypothetical protein
MKYFTCTFLQDAYFLFIETDIDTCISRIHYRVAHAHASHHFVPDSILRGYYAQDNFEYMESSFKDEYKIKKGMKAILNNNRSIEDYSEEIKKFTQAILTSEDSKVLK